MKNNFSIMTNKKAKTTAKPEAESSDKFPCTIDETLLKSWQLMRRVGDIEDITEKTGKSRPIVYNALKYGHVKDEALEREISKYYIERAQTQRSEAQQILTNIA